MSDKPEPSPAHVRLPEGTAYVSESLFEGNFTLESVYLPDSVRHIDRLAFARCYSLREIRLPPGLERIAERAFLGCIRLREILLPDTVRSIGEMAFKSCESLESPALPAELTYLGRWAFDGCIQMKSISLPARLQRLGEGVFLRCATLCAIDVDPGNDVLSTHDGVLFDRDQTLLIAYPEGRPEPAYRVPETVVRIEAGAFKSAVHLLELMIPDTVRQIGDWAFTGCRRLRWLQLPAGLDEIGEGLCAGCVRLQEAQIPGAVRLIGDKAFSECRSLLRLVVPSQVNSIGSRSFFGLHLVEIRPSRDVIRFPDWSRLTWEQANGFCACVAADDQGTRIDYVLYDQLSEQVIDVEDRFRMAVVQFRNPIRMTPQRKARYLDFLAGHVREGLQDCLERNDVEGIRLLLAYRLLTADAVEKAIDLANTGRHAEIMMALLVYQQEQFGTRKLDYSL